MCNNACIFVAPISNIPCSTLFKEDMGALGLKVSTEVPSEVYALMDLYEQPTQARPSVQYIPVPYKEGGKEANSPK